MSDIFISDADRKLMEIRRRGASAYRLNRDEYRNPFSVGSLEFDEFERGWMQALKTDDSAPARMSSSSFSVGAADKSQSNGVLPIDLDVEFKAERYRSLKG